MHFRQQCGEWARRIRVLFSDRWRFDREIEEEMALHRDLRAEELQQNGTDAKKRATPHNVASAIRCAFGKRFTTPGAGLGSTT